MQNLSKCIKRTPELRMRLMDNSSHALEVIILFFNRTVWTQKAKRAKRFYSLLCLLLRLTNKITDKWTVGYLSVHVFILAPKYELRTPFLRGTADAWGLHFTWSSKPRKGLAICRARAVSSFLSHIKTLSMVRPRESNLRPPAQAVKRLSDWVACWQALRAALALERPIWKRLLYSFCWLD